MRASDYAKEFGRNWRALAAAALGLGSGIALQLYATSLFAPALMKEFGWSKAEFALVGMISVVALIIAPFAGRIADRIGVRKTAAIGVVGVPLTFFGQSAIDSLDALLSLMILQTIFGATTGIAVYCRLVAERFEKTRGLALALVICCPAFIAAVGTPLLSDIIAQQGWRAGYQALGVFSAVLGALTMTLIPAGQREKATLAQGSGTRDYKRIFRSRPFWFIAMGMLLCNLVQTLPASQLKLLLLDNGTTDASATALISLYAVGVMVGRFLCGLALDVFPAHRVAAFAMAIPGAGLLILASSWDGNVALGIAILSMGLSQGAEGDVGAYLVARHFGLDIYSSVLGLVTASIGIGTALGTVMLSITLVVSESFDLFLVLGAVAVFAGSGLFLTLGRVRPPSDPVGGDVGGGAMPAN